MGQRFRRRALGDRGELCVSQRTAHRVDRGRGGLAHQRPGGTRSGRSGCGSDPGTFGLVTRDRASVGRGACRRSRRPAGPINRRTTEPRPTTSRRKPTVMPSVIARRNQAARSHAGTPPRGAVVSITARAPRRSPPVMTTRSLARPPNCPPFPRGNARAVSPVRPGRTAAPSRQPRGGLTNLAARGRSRLLGARFAGSPLGARWGGEQPSSVFAESVLAAARREPGRLVAVVG